MQRYVAYYRVSTARQGASGLGLDAQRATVAAFVDSAHSELIAEFQEVESGKRDDRPALSAAIRQCRLTGAKLLIAKLDRLSRDVHFLTGLERQGIDFTACDLPSANRLTVHIMAAVAQAERDMISSRTKAALAAIKDRIARDGEYTSKRSDRPIRRLGNPNGLASRQPQLGTRALVARADAFASSVAPTISDLRASGLSLAVIAGRLNQMSVQTARGSNWTATAVRRVLVRKGSP